MESGSIAYFCQVKQLFLIVFSSLAGFVQFLHPHQSNSLLLFAWSLFIKSWFTSILIKFSLFISDTFALCLICAMGCLMGDLYICQSLR